jgi:hypothetical protein
MEWLVTTTAGADLDDLEAKLRSLGVERTEIPPVPLGSDEIVIEVSGPRDLPSRARQAGLDLIIHPSSRMTLY